MQKNVDILPLIFSPLSSGVIAKGCKMVSKLRNSVTESSELTFSPNNDDFYFYSIESSGNLAGNDIDSQEHTSSLNKTVSPSEKKMLSLDSNVN